MNIPKPLFFYLFLAIILSLQSCSEDTNDDPVNNTGSIAGVLTTTNGDGLAGALIESSGVSTLSDSEGGFLLDDVPTGNKLLIKLSKSGYASNFKLVPVVEDQISTVYAALSPTSLETQIDPNLENQIEFEGAKVKMPANGLVDQNGNMVGGNVTVQATYFDPTDDQYYNVFPGSFEGISSDGQEGLLESFGFIDVNFMKNGAELDLADGVSAEISIPIPQELMVNAPNPIPLFYFDELDGVWKEDGSADIVDGKYVGEVGHFSSWNADFWYDDEICILKGRVVDQDGNPLWLARVYADGTDFVGSNYAITDLDGRFSMQIKSDASVKVKAYWTSIIFGIWYGESEEITISNTCPPGGMNDIGDVVIEVDSSDPNGTGDEVWWDVYIHPYPTGEIANSDVVDVWRVGKGGKIEFCEDCNSLSPNWQPSNSNTTETILSIHFTDRDHGWICGNNGLLKKTSNRGQTWETVILETFGNDLYEIEFTDEYHGFMVGTAGHVWYTLDGGQTWTKANTNFGYDLWDMDFVSTKIGWAVGPVGRIFKTTDGGLNWTEQFSGVTKDLYGVSFVNKFYGWVVGLDGTLLYTEDEGNSWNPLNPGTMEDLLAVEFYQPNFGVVTGSNGTILTSFDRGASWNLEDIGDQELWCVNLYDYYGIIGGEGLSNFLGDPDSETVPNGWNAITSPTLHDLNAITFKDENSGYIAGDNGVILHTNNGGINWNELNTSISEDLTDISVVGSAIFLCGGDESIHRSLDNGQTWKTLRKNQGSIWEYSKIQFTSEEKGFVLGKVGIQEFIYTVDTGNTWVTVPNLPGVGTEVYIYDFEFTSESNGFVSGYSIIDDKGIFYQTTNGGLHWNLIYELAPFGMVNNVRFEEMECPGNDIIYMDQAYMLFKSIDNGSSWNVTSSYVPNEFRFVDEQRAWGIGFYKLLGGGTTILFSDNGGRSWKPQGSDAGAIEYINDIFMLNEDVGIAVGTDGQIYRTEKGGF